MIGFFCLGVFLLVGWVGSFLLFIKGRRSKSRNLTIVGGTFFGLGTTTIILLVLYFIYSSSPVVVYQYTFGMKPPADVSNIKSSQYYFLDTGHTYLKFNASPNTVAKIISRGLQEKTDMRLDSSGAPKWWDPPLNSDVEMYQGYFEDRDFGFEREQLIYDPATQTVYFYFLGID